MDHSHHHSVGHQSRTTAGADSSLVSQPSVTGTVYTCPMHPEIRQDHPGTCPKCGMSLEPVMPSLDQDEDPELREFQQRFWWTLPLTVVVAFLAMAGHRVPGLDIGLQTWLELALSLPIVLWAGMPESPRVL